MFIYAVANTYWWKGQSRAICDISSLTPAQFTAWQEQRYTQDKLFNPVELAQDIPPCYIHHVFLGLELGVVLAHRGMLQELGVVLAHRGMLQELGVVLAHRGMLQELRAVLSVPGAQPQLLLYNTTYNLGEFLCHQWFFYTWYLRKHQSHQQHFFFMRESLSLSPPPHTHMHVHTHTPSPTCACLNSCCAGGAC